MGLIAPTAVHFEVGAVKKNASTRLACGNKIASQGPTSPLYLNGTLKGPIDVVIADTATVQAALAEYGTAQAAFLKARTALGLAIGNWDGSYDVLVAAGEKHCVTPNDGSALGMPVLVDGKAKYALAAPLSVELKQDFKKSRLIVHVHRAPGMRATLTQISADPITATSWKDLDGDGAIHFLPNPSPGILWARAASKRARAVSDFTVPVCIIVK